MKYMIAIFDLDGTILNTLEDLADSTNYALKTCGYPERTMDEVRQFVGNGIRKLMERAVPEGTPVEEIDRVHETFTAHYKVHCADKTRPYDGIMELLQNLKKDGCKLAVVSNKADYGVQELCKQYFDGVFDFAVGEREGIRKKPAPDSVNEVLKTLGCSRDRAVYIGDSDVDIQTAANAQMDHIIVEWGFRDVPFLIAKGAKVLVEKPEEILEIVEGR
ncbi:HAD family hydrolase [Lachnospiraceae bacterium AM48-27BH]|nr:HAD family hydrolase [Lachnospiraceae bacterium AM48-27BH]